MKNYFSLNVYLKQVIIKLFFYLSLFVITTNSLFSQKILENIKAGNYSKVVKWLEKHDVINETYIKKDDTGKIRNINVIEWASFHNQMEIVELFIENKSKFEYYDSWINHSIGASIHNCNIELTSILLMEGAQLTVNCQMCRDASLLAIALNYNCIENYSLLKSQGAPLVSQNTGYDVIHIAAMNSDLDFLKELVEKENLDVNQKGSVITAPIFLAIDSGRIENIKYLISKGAKLDVLDASGKTIFHHINDLSTFLFFEELIKTNSNISINKSEKIEPLIMSIVESDNRELFDYFVSNYNSLLKSKNSEGHNAMFQLLLTEKETEYFFEVLKRNNVPHTLKDESGKDVKFYAKKMKKTTLLNLLKG